MISEFFHLFQYHGKRLVGVLMLGVASALLMAIVDPIAMKLLIDKGLGDKNLPLFLTIIAMVITTAAFVSALKLAEALWSQRLKNDITASLCDHMLKTYYEIPYLRIKSEGDGYFISRVYEEPRKVIELALSLLQQMLARVVTVIAALGISLYLSWRVTVILVVVVPLLYTLSKKFSGRISKESKSENEAEATYRKGLARSLGAYVTIKSFGLRGHVTSSVALGLDAFFAAMYQRVRSTWIFRTASGMSMALAESAVLSAAALDVFLGHMTVGSMLGYMAGFWKLMGGATGLIEQLPELARAHGYIQRMREFEREARPAVASPTTAMVRLHKAQFGYETQPVLSNFDLSIFPGERVLVLGQNGCGKTTLGLILGRFLNPDNADAPHRIPAPERVSAMLAPLTFFLGSLREHLRLDSLAPERRSMAMAMLADFDIADKLDSDPQSFSEGERRKAYVTLCLLKDADLYVLDEPLSGVDEGSKATMVDWILKSTEHRMLLTIMHGDDAYHDRFTRVVRLSPRSLSVPDGMSVKERTA